MKSLLLVAHGSRRAESKQEIESVAAALRDRSQDSYSLVQCAFLELAQPSIPQAIDDLVSTGATDIVVLPYFLSAGRHVHEDIPQIIEQKRSQYQQVKIVMTPYLGESSEIIQVLVGLSKQSDA